MTKRSQSDLNWLQIDPASLPKASQEAYAKYKAAYEAMKAERARFEDGIRAAFAHKTPQGKRVVVGYNFGKLSLAIADAPEKAPAKGAVSFADLLR